MDFLLPEGKIIGKYKVHLEKKLQFYKRDYHLLDYLTSVTSLSYN